MGEERREERRKEKGKERKEGKKAKEKKGNIITDRKGEGESCKTEAHTIPGLERENVVCECVRTIASLVLVGLHIVFWTN